MNQPTEDRIKKLEEEQMQLKEEVRQLKRQQTEPIPVTRVEVVTPDILQQHQQELKQMLQQNYKAIMEGMVKTTRDENKSHIEQLEKTLATKDDLGAMKNEIIDAVRKISSPGKN